MLALWCSPERTPRRDGAGYLWIIRVRRRGTAGPLDVGRGTYEGGGTRTHDLGIKSPLLYQLSYAPESLNLLPLCGLHKRRCGPLGRESVPWWCAKSHPCAIAMVTLRSTLGGGLSHQHAGRCDGANPTVALDTLTRSQCVPRRRPMPGRPGDRHKISQGGPPVPEPVPHMYQVASGVPERRTTGPPHPALGLSLT